MLKKSIPFVTVFSGGVGGTKLVEGLSRVMPEDHLTVIGNTGDDVVRHGLWISPDLDIITYTLADVEDPARGWGFRNDTYEVLHQLERLGEETWFQLGDRDMATHLLRTALKNAGISLTEITDRIRKRLGVKVRILPPADDPIQTEIKTTAGWLSFQEFYVKQGCRPKILDVRYQVSKNAHITDETRRAIEETDLLVFAPSNPIASIGPILSVPGVRESIEKLNVPRVVVSPIVGGKSLKGPSDRMMATKGFSVNSVGVADFYHEYAGSIIMDFQDLEQKEAVEKKGFKTILTCTVMDTLEDRARLAHIVLNAREM